jgi:DNA-binding MarR family transcriptional regulator
MVLTYVSKGTKKVLPCQHKSAYTPAVGTRKHPELELWRLWKMANETVRGRIFEEGSASSGLSDADIAVLFRVADSANHEMRQHELAASLRWHRSRLSHQLTRMEQRGLLRRMRVDSGVLIAVTGAGIAAIETARPILAAAIRKHFIDLIPNEHKQAFQAVLERLVDGKR